MEESKYAAIAAYDYSLRKEGKPGDICLLILDLGEIEGALCIVNEDGEVNMKEVVPSPGKATLFSRFAERIRRSEADTYRIWREHCLIANKKLEAYIVNPERNYPVLPEIIPELDCDGLTHMFKQDQARITDLLRAVAEMLHRNGVDWETLRILLSGKEASFIPAVFTVRSFFNPDEPWLADDRFAEFDEEADPAAFASMGEPILRELANKPFGHDISIICRVNVGNGKDMPEHPMALAQKEQQINSMDKPNYGEGIYLTDRSKLTLSVDGKRVLLSLRDRGIYEGIYQAGLQISEKRPELCLRRMDKKTDQIFIPISV